MLCSELLKHVDNLDFLISKDRIPVIRTDYFCGISSIELLGLNYLKLDSSQRENKFLNFIDFINLLKKYPNKKLIFDRKGIHYHNINYIGVNDSGNLVINLTTVKTYMKEPIIFIKE